MVFLSSPAVFDIESSNFKFVPLPDNGTIIRGVVKACHVTDAAKVIR